MPNARRRIRKKTGNSRLRDKKINTLIEKRMDEIAKKEVKKRKFLLWSV